MNFLAHLYLSGGHPGIMVGNFIGDFVKGRNLYSRYEAAIAAGVELHRAIDEFTDQHTAVKASKQRLRPGYRHYAGVLVDIFYDHFLARQWDEHHPQLLPDFAEQVYRLMDQHHPVLPPKVQYMLPYMTRENWLANYARLEGIDRALKGMARRTRHISHMELALTDLKAHYHQFNNEFNNFFPEVSAFAARWLSHKGFQV
ncbi:MAG: ACP phosphodiesterase [Cyclobacteriaceae bacterium]|nr:MAG: ACP phosphodiesterase [Cyclobacteriaceae bacterium]